MAIFWIFTGLFLGNWLLTNLFVEDPIHLFQGLQTLITWGVEILGLGIFAWLFGSEEP
ncbi:MAG: hypothetical protein ACKN9E_01445 [Microcystaceae cyanobacterium]